MKKSIADFGFHVSLATTASCDIMKTKRIIAAGGRKENMKSLNRKRDEGRRGEGKLLPAVFIAAVVIGVFVVIKVVPVYRTKWALESEMQKQMMRFASLGEDGIKGLLADYCKLQQLPIDPYEACTFEGERCEPGTMTCVYVKEVNFLVYKKIFYMTAVAKLEKIPCDSY